jgi:hypothetical protein
MLFGIASAIWILRLLALLFAALLFAARRRGFILSDEERGKR